MIRADSEHHAMSRRFVSIARRSGFDYADDIDYREVPGPPLTGDDANWADALLREQGRR